MKNLRSFEDFLNESGLKAKNLSKWKLEDLKQIVIDLLENGNDLRKPPLSDFIDELKRRKDQIKESEDLNEEFVEMPNFDIAISNLVGEYLDWYRATKSDWESHKEYMTQQSVDEAARDCQMEILTNLSNEMNAIIKDRKFKVRMDLK